MGCRMGGVWFCTRTLLKRLGPDCGQHLGHHWKSLASEGSVHISLRENPEYATVRRNHSVRSLFIRRAVFGEG